MMPPAPRMGLATVSLAKLMSSSTGVQGVLIGIYVAEGHQIADQVAHAVHTRMR